MGKNKHKNRKKKKSVTEKKEGKEEPSSSSSSLPNKKNDMKDVSEADAAAGILQSPSPTPKITNVPLLGEETKSEKKKKKKRSLDDIDSNDSDNNDNNDNNERKDDPPEESPQSLTQQQQKSKQSPKQQQQQQQQQEQHLTRKEKRQKLNEKNKWPQHPKIQNSDARNKAYLRVAGIEPISEEQFHETEFPTTTTTTTTIDEKKKKQNKKQQQVSSEEDTNNDQEWRRFGRFLGGTDARTRHRAVKRLGQYLKIKSGYGIIDDNNDNNEDDSNEHDDEEEEDTTTNNNNKNKNKYKNSSNNNNKLDQVSGLSELDWMKLWKGLWFTLYMADKVPVQDELSKHIAKLLWCISGTIEEDIFAGEAYLAMQEEEEEEEEEDEEEDDDDDDEVEDFKILETKYVEMDGSDDSEDEMEDVEEDNNDDDESNDESQGMKDNDREENDDGHATHDDGPDEEVKHIRGAPLAMLMIRTFFRTLLREWGNMDKYRIDKFYTLVRYMIREVYRYMATRQWNLGIIRLFNDAIAEEALLHPPNGVRYHLIDIALEELVLIANHKKSKNGENKFLPITEAIFLEIMEPFIVMAQHGFGDKSVQARVVEKILEKFLLEHSVVCESNIDDDDDDDKKETRSNDKIFDQVHVGTISKFIFDLAANENTLDIHRKSLYDMHKKYERQLKKVGTDVKIDDEEEEEEGEEELDDDEDDGDYNDEAMDAEEDNDENLEAMGFVAESDSDEEQEDEEEEPPHLKTKNSKPKDKNIVTKEKTSKESPKEKKSKKMNLNDQMDLTHHGGGDAFATGNKEKKHKKKKEKKKQNDMVTEGKEENEETVVISLSEQKKAKNANKKEQNEHAGDMADDSIDDKNSKQGKKKKKKKKKESKSIEKDEDGRTSKKQKRRVSFGKKNTARAWKVSMAGLRTLDPTETLSKTPEKSILRNKHKKSPINKNATKPRKRAVDYF